MRRIAVLVAACGAAAALVAPAWSAESHVIDVEQRAERDLAEVRTHTDVPILFPSKIRSPIPDARLRSGAGGGPGYYGFQMKTKASCPTAHERCFVAGFKGERGVKRYYRTRVKLGDGRRAWYRRVTCGRGCASIGVQWMQGDVLYTFDVRDLTQRRPQSVIIALADKARAAGPR